MALQLDSSYKEVHKFGGVNGLDGDLHECLITEDGTVLITVYQAIPYDLSPIGGQQDGSIWDCLIQEIDLATGHLLFEWRASEHHALNETHEEPGDATFDWYHINSIAKDHKGNYLVSARYTHGVTYISGATGEILWVLGGKRNNFKDLSNGKATDFVYQHDARWHDDFSTITIFDNGGKDGYKVAEYSRGMRIAIDQEAMTATLVTEYINPQKIHGISQGSLQVLPNGHVLAGYGNSGAMTEFADNGTVLCDVHFGPGDFFGHGDVMSYRIFKFDWVGRPSTNPEIGIVHNNETHEAQLYVSWNGATEVANWILQAANEAENPQWDIVGSVAKDGFEAMFSLSDTSPTYVRVLAVDRKGHILGRSDAWNWMQGEMAPVRCFPNLVSHPSSCLSHFFCFARELHLIVFDTQLVDNPPLGSERPSFFAASNWAIRLLSIVGVAILVRQICIGRRRSVLKYAWR